VTESGLLSVTVNKSPLALSATLWRTPGTLQCSEPRRM